MGKPHWLLKEIQGKIIYNETIYIHRFIKKDWIDSTQ